MEINKKEIYKLCLASIFLAIGIVLPFLTGQIPEIGKMLCPMHIPVLLCGFLCGWKYGLLVGFILPILRSLLFSVPALFPNASAMAFELGIYGFVSGLLSPKINNIFKLYLFLIISMISGRIIWGIVMMTFMGITGSKFTFNAFLAGSLLNAWPGIIIQLIIIPILLITIKKIKSVKTN